MTATTTDLGIWFNGNILYLGRFSSPVRYSSGGKSEYGLI